MFLIIITIQYDGLQTKDLKYNRKLKKKPALPYRHDVK